MHLPDWQVSLTVQGLPSSQAPDLKGCLHRPAWQTSLVQG